MSKRPSGADRPRPIRFDRDTWLVMRSDPVVPKAVIVRHVDKGGRDQYFVFKWDLDPAKRRLMSVCTSLERADDLVRYDTPPLPAHLAKAGGYPAR